jgi:ATPase subunit of ABC transporter with duplicated ATPase domains
MVQRIMNTHDHTTLGCLLTAVTLHLDQFDLIDENFEFLRFPYTNERKEKAERKRSRSRSQEKVKSKKKKNKDRDSKSASDSKSESRKKKAKKEDKSESEEKKISLISAVLRKLHKMPLTNLNSVYRFSMGVFSLLADVYSLLSLSKSISNRTFAKVRTNSWQNTKRLELVSSIRSRLKHLLAMRDKLVNSPSHNSILKVCERLLSLHFQQILRTVFAKSSLIETLIFIEVMSFSKR